MAILAVTLLVGIFAAAVTADYLPSERYSGSVRSYSRPSYSRSPVDYSNRQSVSLARSSHSSPAALTAAVRTYSPPLVTARISYKPVSVAVTVHTSVSGDYHYYSYTRNSVRYEYTSTICSAPPSSIEICLSSVFSSIDTALVSIYRSLHSHEITIKSEMHHEHSELTSEESLIRIVGSIAASVREYVYIEYENLVKQVTELTLEKQQIYAAYYYLYAKLKLLLSEVTEVKAQEQLIVEQYTKIEAKKWSIYSYISAITYEKRVVYKEVQEINYVVYYLNIQVYKIQERIGQLVKRQTWLQQWEVTLYTELEHFEKYVKEFKSVQKYLKIQETALFQEQTNLYEEIVVVQQAIVKLKAEEAELVEYLNELAEYEKKIEYIAEHVSTEASVFISLYTKFTCEDSLLYYEACSSKLGSRPAPPASAAPPA